MGVQGVCPAACPAFQSQGVRVLIIKLGALGDVIRTAALLPVIRRHWPQSHITWVSRSSGVRVLTNHPQVDRLLVFDAESTQHLTFERFDVCLSLDKEPGPAALAMRIDAPDRRGIGLSRHGTPIPLNPECEHYFALGLDDDLKFHGNHKSYPQLIAEALGLTYRGERYTLHPSPAQRSAATARWRRLGLTERSKVIGLNTGAGTVFAHKSPGPEKWKEIARRFLAENRFRVVLLGGRAEAAMNQAIAQDCPGVIDMGSDHDELTFAALVEHCGVILTGDTMAMHVAIAMRTPVVALFGPTCEQEIDLFGNGVKLTAGLACSPCYRRQCELKPDCMEALAVETIVTATSELLDRTDSARPAQKLPVLSALRPVAARIGV